MKDEGQRIVEEAEIMHILGLIVGIGLLLNCGFILSKIIRVRANMHRVLRNSGIEEHLPWQPSGIALVSAHTIGLAIGILLHSGVSGECIFIVYWAAIQYHRTVHNGPLALHGIRDTFQSSVPTLLPHVPRRLLPEHLCVVLIAVAL